jgi:hypothetical protein
MEFLNIRIYCLDWKFQNGSIQASEQTTYMDVLSALTLDPHPQRKMNKDKERNLLKLLSVVPTPQNLKTYSKIYIYFKYSIRFNFRTKKPTSQP